MDCKTFIYTLTSGQLERADGMTRIEARFHQLICRRCRTFKRNDGVLTEVLDAYRDHLLEAPPPAETDPGDVPK